MTRLETRGAIRNQLDRSSPLLDFIACVFIVVVSVLIGIAIGVGVMAT